MNWIIILGIIACNIFVATPFFLYFRNELNNDRRHRVNLLMAFQKEMRDLKIEFQEDMRDLNRRLSKVEETNKK